ncbi:hypothetical protein BH11PLA1_BH11PLA1_09710 [soil metagenome]
MRYADFPLLSRSLGERRERTGVLLPRSAGGSLRCGFTLIELLAVIAVVALLLGLLAPALNGARSAAQSAACGSNLRQLAMALDLYAGANGGHYAPGAADFAANRSRWHGARAAGVGSFSPTGGALTPFLDDAATPGGGASAEMVTTRACPTFAPVARNLASAGRGFERSAGGYGYNNAFAGQVRSAAGTGAGRMWALVTDRSGALQARFEAPGRTLGFADAALCADSGANAEGLIEYSFIEGRFRADVAPGEGARMDPSLHFRHGQRMGSGKAGTCNAAYLDGHVAGMARTFTWSSGVYGVPGAAAALGWSGSGDDNSMFAYR